MSDETVTPAGRLLELVHEGRKRRSTQKTRASSVWAEVFGVQPDSTDYLRLMADLTRMVADVIDVVGTAPITERARENYLGTLRHFLRAFQPPALNQPFENTVKNFLTDQHVRDLENLDSQLAHLHSSPRISDEQVEEIRTDADHVLELLEGADLPDELARLLRSHVEVIRRVVQHYRIYGNEGLHDELRRILGDLVLHHEIFERHGQSRAVRAFKGLVGKVMSASKLMMQAAVGGAVTWLLGP